jgi:hypothetical protein
MGGLSPYAFGMVGNAYSIAELIDLVAAKDVTIANLDRLLAEVQAKPFDTTDVSNRLSALKSRYQAARTDAESAITLARLNFITPNSMIPGDSQYRAILAACNPKWQEHTWSPGDGSVEDIDSTLTNMGATRTTAEPIPQPQSGTDFDLNQMHAANTAITMAEGAAKGAGSLLGKGVSGIFGNLDTATIAKIVIIAGLGVVVLPKLLAMGPAKLLIR